MIRIDTLLGEIAVEEFGTYDEYPGVTVFINEQQVATVEFSHTFGQLQAVIWQGDYENDPIACYEYDDLKGIDPYTGWDPADSEINVPTPQGIIDVRQYGTFNEFPGITVFINSRQVVTVEYTNTFDRLQTSVWYEDYDNDPVATFDYPDLEKR